MTLSNLNHLSDKDDSLSLHLALEHYSHCFDTNAGIQQRLHELTGISFGTAKKLGFGFGDRTLSHQLPQIEKPSGDNIRGSLQRVGFLKPNGREKFRGAITIPICQRGILVDVCGYWIGKSFRKGQYPSETMRVASGAFFNGDCLTHIKHAYVCSTLFDAITIQSLGAVGVIAPLHSNHFSDENTANLLRYGVREVTVCIPNDERGRRFAHSVRRAVESIGLLCNMSKSNYPVSVYEASATLSGFRSLQCFKGVA